MKKLTFTLAVAALIIMMGHAQTLYIIAGNGDMGYSGNGGPATGAELSGPYGVSFDGSGNIYIADFNSSLIREVNTSGIISTFAGIYNPPFGGYSGDGGPATASEINEPWDVTVDGSGNVYFSDASDMVIRKVNTSGIISTYAGNLSAGGTYTGDGGVATAAGLAYPQGIGVDASGNLYIADNNNNVIREVNTSGIINTVAGNGFGHGGAGAYSGDGGAATAAELNAPSAVAIDVSGNIYIADANNNVIRKVTKSIGIISTVAGNYAYGSGFSGDGGPATSAELYSPSGICVNSNETIFISDNYRIRMINSSGIINTVAGGGSSTSSGIPANTAAIGDGEIAVDGSGNLYLIGQETVCRVTDITGIEKISDNFGVVVYPNPAKENLYIRIQNSQNATLISLYTITGQQVMAMKLEGKEIIQLSTGNLNEGTYLMKIALADGNYLTCKVEIVK